MQQLQGTNQPVSTWSEISQTNLNKPALFGLQSAELLSDVALALPQCVVLHLQLTGMGGQLGHLLSQFNKQSPILPFHWLQISVMVGERVQQWGLHTLQTQEVIVVVRAVGVDEDVDAGAVTSLDGYQGISLILVSADERGAVRATGCLIMVHQKDDPSNCDSQ